MENHLLSTGFILRIPLPQLVPAYSSWDTLFLYLLNSVHGLTWHAFFIESHYRVVITLQKGRELLNVEIAICLSHIIQIMRLLANLLKLSNYAHIGEVPKRTFLEFETE